MLGLGLGALAGSWFGLMGGLIYAELAKISCVQGHCGAVAASIAGFGAVAGGLAGGFVGLRRGRRLNAGNATRSSA